MKRIALVLSLFSLAACGGSKDASGPPSDPAIAAAGTYNLKIFNGLPIPAQYFQNAAATLTILAGTEVLRADHSYTETWTTRSSYNPGYGCGCVTDDTRVIDSGRFEIIGSSSITFYPDAAYGGGSYPGAVANGALTYTLPDYSLRYQR